MTILIYDNCLDGHHLEYIHHIYVRAAFEGDNSYIFVIPDHFLAMRKLLRWPDSPNISFDYLSENETRRCNRNKYLHFWGTQTYSAWLLCKKIKNYSPDHVFMVSIDMGIPFVELFLKNSKTKISCISYRMIPYQWKSLPIIKKGLEWLTYNVVLKKNRYPSVFLLNNHKFVGLYNNKFKTDKYRYLTDPITIENKIGKDLRDPLKIPKDAKVYVHLGAMGIHKGTLNLLEAIGMLDETEAENRYFIFGGKLGEDIKVVFYKKLESLPDYCHVIVYDRFCEFELFCSFYQTCDYVVFPYLPRPNSSGLLGNAAFYGKPVITTDGGAMGDLVREYKLGYLMPDNSPQSIYEAIKNSLIEVFTPRKYVETHTIDNFCDQIFSVFI